MCEGVCVCEVCVRDIKNCSHSPIFISISENGKRTTEVKVFTLKIQNLGLLPSS